MATKKEVAQVLGLLAACYPRYQLTDDTVDAYVLMLADIPADLLKAGAIEHARQSKWFPSVAELVGSAHDVGHHTVDALVASEAWGVVMRRLRVPDRTWIAGQEYVRRPCDENTERAVKAIGGWTYLRHSEDGVADRARFIQAYQDIATQQKRRDTEHPAVTETRLSIAERTHLREISDGPTPG